jgi:hypothetical protein
VRCAKGLVVTTARMEGQAEPNHHLPAGLMSISLSQMTTPKLSNLEVSIGQRFTAENCEVLPDNMFPLFFLRLKVFL